MIKTFVFALFCLLSMFNKMVKGVFAFTITVIFFFFHMSNFMKTESMSIDAHRVGAPHVPPIKIFEKLPHKNAIKHDPPFPPPDFITTPCVLFSLTSKGLPTRIAKSIAQKVKKFILA